MKSRLRNELEHKDLIAAARDTIGWLCEGCRVEVACDQGLDRFDVKECRITRRLRQAVEAADGRTA